MPKSTYGTDIFSKVQDKDERWLIKEMLASALDSMQDFHDCTEMKLGKPLLTNDNEQLEHFVIPFRKAIGAKRSRFEDVSLQAKYLTKKE